MKGNEFNPYAEEEKKATKTTLRRFKKALEIYERSFNMCYETVSAICDSTKDKLLDSTAKHVILLMLPRIMQSMQSIRDLVMKAYYYDAAVLERSFVESLGLCAYLSVNEGEAKRWRDGKKINVASINLLEYVPRLLGGVQGTNHSDDAKRVYGELCDYVHTNVRAVVSLIPTLKTRAKHKKVGAEIGAELSFEFAPKFDSRAQEQMYGVSIYPLVTALVLLETFKLELGEKREKKMLSFAKQVLRQLP